MIRASWTEVSRIDVAFKEIMTDGQARIGFLSVSHVPAESGGYPRNAGAEPGLNNDTEIDIEIRLSALLCGRIACCYAELQV